MTIAPSTPYDTAGSILNTARSISADAATSQGLAGDILADSQPYLFPLLQKCYRDLQDELISKSVETFTKFGHIYGITPTQAASARTNVTISFLGYFNGNTVLPNITLPQDCIKPLELWECISGANSWQPMRPVADAIASRPTSNRFGVWDFANDILILPGSSQTEDIKLKYLCYAPDLTGPDSVAYVLHCQTALSNLLVSAVSKMLGGLEMAGVFEKDAHRAIDMIVNRTARREAYQSFSRIPFRGRGRGRGRGGY